MKVGDLVRSINQPVDDFIPAHWRGVIVGLSLDLGRNLQAIVFWNREYSSEREYCNQLEVVSERPICNFEDPDSLTSF